MIPVIDLGIVQIPTFYFIISMTVTFLLLGLQYQLHQHPDIDRKIAFDLTLIMMLAGFGGARLIHVIYEEPHYYLEAPAEIFKFWQGGFVFYGGFITALIAVFIYLKKKKENFLAWADLFTPYISLSYALGRLGCFAEGCCYGKACSLPWAISGLHPTQLYMFFAEMGLLAFLISLFKLRKTLKQTRPNKIGLFFTFWLLGHAAIRFVVEFFRNDDRGFVFIGLTISQWISLVLIAFSLILIQRINRFTSHH